MLEGAYALREESIEKKRIAGDRMQTVLSDYAGSRQAFFEAHLDIEKANKLIKKLERGEAGDDETGDDDPMSGTMPRNDDVDSRSSSASYIFDDHSSTHSSISWS